MENNNIIISFTSYPARFKYCPKVIDSILNNTIQPYKICLTVYKDDLEYLPEELQIYIENNIIELIIAEEDLKCHLKYFYVMQKYRENPIIIIDDDSVYPNDLISSLYYEYLKTGNYILSRRTTRKIYNNKGLVESKYWPKEYKNISYPSFELVANGVGGVLYPPDILHITNDCIPLIKQVLYNDDIYLHYLSMIYIIPTLYVNNNKNHPTNIDGSQDNALWLSRNDEHNQDNECDKAINLLLKQKYLK